MSIKSVELDDFEVMVVNTQMSVLSINKRYEETGIGYVANNGIVTHTVKEEE